jgi:uncharacterized membrane protein
MKIFSIISQILNILLLSAIVVLMSVSLYYIYKTFGQFTELNDNARVYNEWIQRVTNPQIGIK